MHTRCIVTNPECSSKLYIEYCFATVVFELGDSHTVRGYGNVAARDWYMELPDGGRHIVDQAGFGAFCRGLSRLTASRPLLAAVVERWWATADSFYLSITGDMTMTPYDFTMLTGIGVGGDLTPFDTEMDEWYAD